VLNVSYIIFNAHPNLDEEAVQAHVGVQKTARPKVQTATLPEVEYINCVS